jgi:2-polyprenyl-3-methyl-5-hydroxy-6-metoxy-1,4-benzoquinol methylase
MSETSRSYIVDEMPEMVNPLSEGAPEPSSAREQRFWDEHVPDLAACLAAYEAGPDTHTTALLRAVEPLIGARVLDFACGAGVTSAWLAGRGAEVTGIDVSPQSVARARELNEKVGGGARFVAGDLDSPELRDMVFDRIVGRFALHHVDCQAIAPQLARHLRPDGLAVFLETMNANPILRIARRSFVGRFGIPRFGTLDEHPLTTADLETLRSRFGSLELETARMEFFRILDRQVLQRRNRWVSQVLGAADDALARLGLGSWSYQQLVLLRRTH